MATNLSENGKLKLDLFLLQLFKSLYQSGSLSRAAEEHGLPIGSASRHLSRLRQFFNDPLFTHCGNGMAPTHRADELMPKINAVLLQLNELLADDIFDPQSLCTTIRIGLVDNATLAFIAPRVSDLQKACPDLTIELIPLYDDFYSLLTSGQLDFVIYPFERKPERQGFHYLKLDDVSFSYVVRKGHPLSRSAKGPGIVTDEDIEKYRMVRIRRHSGTAVSPTSSKLNNQNQRDPVAIYTSYFVSSPFLILETDYILVLPTATANYLSRLLPLEVLNLCPDSPDMAMHMIWHDRGHSSPALQWIRSFLMSQKVSSDWHEYAQNA